MISLDTETTGLDMRHGCKPFMVQTCDEEGTLTCWEWDVNPMTRQPRVPRADLDEIQEIITNADALVLQNPKFDVLALQSVFASVPLDWDWSKVYDTLLAGHLLASNQPHDLASMALIYLGINIQTYNDALRDAVNSARRIARTDYPRWRIAKKGLPELPSAKGSVWKYDAWLPRTVARIKNYAQGKHNQHAWWTVCSEYGNGDAEVTLLLFKEQRRLLKKQNLWRIYLERLKVLPIVCKMESRGVTLSRTRLEEAQQEYQVESQKAGSKCVNIAKSRGYDLVLPKSGNNKSLTGFIFGDGGLDLEPVKVSKKTGQPSLDKETLEHYQTTLPRRSTSLLFVDSLLAKRKRDTALAYMEGYKSFWLKVGLKCKSIQGWYRLHPSLNPTGTATLRWSSQNPNAQNISKQSGFNLRYSFGPLPGREWWSLDAKNIELRIPAYEAGETEQIELFEKPDEPPFFGSNHLLIFSILHPAKWDHDDPEGLLKAKKKYADTWYQWLKNGNFAVQYGAVEASGTADRTYHVNGAQRIIARRFRKAKALNEKLIKYAGVHGYVETMPDKSVDPKRGYPLLCARTSYGRILPTVPLNYHVQGTACWWMMRAMIRCQEYLDGLNAEEGSKGYYMIMQVHDELVFDFPKSRNCGPIPTNHGNMPGKLVELENLPKIRKIAELMGQGGDDIGVPTPVSIEYHAETWSEGVSV